ncbi:MAG: glycosyltransferase [Capsulimonadales bacterium]|nr:glycosyltransferase [Capsulimonadales bacterium]
MANRVPNVFHFVFGLRPQTEPFHLLFYLCLKSCLDVNRPEKIYFHYQNEPWGEWWERIKPHLTLNPITPNSFMAEYKYQNKELAGWRYAHLSDFTRMEMLLRYGGVYADMDTLFIAPLPASLFEKSFVMGEEAPEYTADGQRKSEGSLCNAWMMGEPDAPFLKTWLDQMETGFDGTWNAHSTLLPFRLSRQYPDQVHVEPQRSFFHLSYTTTDLKRIFFENHTDMEGVYSLHLWSHLWHNRLWWNREVLTPAFLSAGLITPAYVLYADTTYAHYARRFLPEDVRASAAQYQRERMMFNLSSLPAYFSEKVSSRAQQMIRK